MNIILIILITIFNFILQSTVFQYISINGVIPNTTLIFITVFALLKGKKVGAPLGLGLGLLHDIVFNDVIGIYALLYFIVGYTIGLIDNNVFKENPLVVVVFTGVSTIGFQFMYYIFMFFSSIDIEFIYFIKNIVIVEVLYNSILSIPIYKFIYSFNKGEKLKFGSR
ncbi:rod shape-determining protein MreD [Dethiothermospora halolimnae]|uniref:rod shape-determining protein MreD n=1 Tax=Dethiothermospora halolimnae TaxID=3114390 RepID=UPI003CCBED4F